MEYKKNDVHVLVVGKSGAGKSEFIGSFSANNKLINSSGGGQTTRTSVEYNFKSGENVKQSVQIHFLTEEKFIEKRIEQIGEIEIPKGKYDLSVKEQVLEIEGFFNYKEFDFINKNVSNQIDDLWGELFPSDFEKESYTQEEYTNLKNKIDERFKIVKEDMAIESKVAFEDDENKKSYNLKDMLELMLQAVYKICKESIKDYPVKFDLENISDEEKKKLTYCLKVDENNKSVTGLISKVVIFDKICDNYEQIFEKLGIENLTFIDTYGLDHDQTATSEVLQHRYSELFNEFPKIETVFFIRALGSDAPTDLASAIPMIYASNPSAVPYILFTKIDENRVIEALSDKSKIDLVNLNNSKNIKAVDYFINRKNEKSIKKILSESKIPDVLIESRYEVLLNNLVPYCSIEKACYNDNNRIYVQQFLKSILNKEHLGKSLVNIDSLNSLKDNMESYNTIIRLLKKMFKEASKDWSSFNLQRRTIGKNRQMLERNQLGYDGTYLDSWQSRFNFGYNEIFSKLAVEDFEMFFNITPNTNESTAIQEILNRFSRYFLRFGNEIEPSNKNLQENFKEIIVCENPEYKKYNKFVCDRKPMYEWLSNVYDFKAYFDDIKKEIYNVFMNNFLESFVSDCREHNARVLAENWDGDFEEYFEKYDTSLKEKDNLRQKVQIYAKLNS